MVTRHRPVRCRSIQQVHIRHPSPLLRIAAESLSRLLPSELPCAAQTLFDITLAQLQVIYHTANTHGEFLRIVRVEQQRGAPNDLGNRPGIGPENGTSAGHRFELYQPKGLVQRRVHQTGGLVVERRRLVCGNDVQQMNSATKAEPLNRLEMFLIFPPRPAGYHKVVRIFSRDEGERPGEHREVLLRIEMAHE